MTDVFGRDDRRNAGALWEYYGCDFVYRNGEWRYLHEHMCPVVNANYDTSNYGHGHELFASSDDNPDYTMWRGIPWEVGDPGPLSDRYNAHQVVQHLIWECPEPYVTLDDEHSYAPGYNNPEAPNRPFIKTARA